MTKTEDRIKKLLQVVRAKTTEMPTISSDNIFSILDVSDKERFHSRFLHYIINTFRDEFCEFCSEQYNMKFPKIKDFGSCCEYPCGKMVGCEKEVDGFIDIFFMTECRPIAIEVKWYAEDQPQQLLRYRECLKQRLSDPILIYLTIDGKLASDGSTSCCDCDSESCAKRRDKLLIDKDYYVMSFAQINAWLGEVLDKSKNKDTPLSQIIKQYREILEVEMNNDDKIATILNRDSSENFFDAAEAIENIMDAVRATISKEFLYKLKETFKKIASYTVYEKVSDKERQTAHVAFGLDPSTEFIVQSNESERFLTIACSTNLYCYVGEGKELKDWSYITKDWFSGPVGVITEQNVKKAVNGKKPQSGQPIVKWWYKSDADRNRELENIMVNAIEYLKISFKD